MVNFSDLKCYEADNSGSNGGPIETSNQIVSATPNNVFPNIDREEYFDEDQDFYRLVYFKNTSSEDMDSFKIGLSSGTPSDFTYLHWAYDPVALPDSGYKFSPYFEATGSTFVSEPDSSALDLQSFSVSCLFRTIKGQTFGGDVMLVNKGGFGSETPGQNLNYGIWMKSTGLIAGGFEETSGTDHYLTSTNSYNDGLWHFAVLEYNKTDSDFSLYVDDMLNTVDDVPTNASPENNTHPLVIGRNSRSSANWFIGQIDEVRVYNHRLGLSGREGIQSGNPTTTGLVYENKFGADDDILTGQETDSVYDSPIVDKWYGTQDGISDRFGTLKAGTAIPIWLHLHISQQTDATPLLDDYGVFLIEFDIAEGGSGTPSVPGSDGNTGGNEPPTTVDFKIALAGDWGCEPETNDVIDLIQDQDYDLVVGVGDNAYENSGCWVDKFNAIKSIFRLSAFGNHEYSESGGTSPYKTFFGVSKTYRTFQFKNIFFLIIDDNAFEDDSAPDFAEGSTQHNFIKSELARVKTDASVVWKIAVMHHPWFGTGADHEENEWDQIDEYHELFQNNKVSFVVTGHNHHWQRSHMCSYDSGSPESPNVVDSSSPYTRNSVGVIHVVTGTGGHDSGGGLYGNSDDAAFWAYRNKSHNGVWEIVASNEGKTLTCSFVDTGGSKFDTFTITA